MNIAEKNMRRAYCGNGYCGDGFTEGRRGGGEEEQLVSQFPCLVISMCLAYSASPRAPAARELQNALVPPHCGYYGPSRPKLQRPNWLKRENATVGFMKLVFSDLVESLYIIQNNRSCKLCELYQRVPPLYSMHYST